jgi:serine/threonine protein kinase
MAIDPLRVKEIFLEAADLADGVARAAFLDKVCGGEGELRARVEALLRSHDPEGSFLGAPAAVVPDPDHAATTDFTPSAAADGTPDDEALAFLAPATRPDALGRIERYEVLQVLGRGGFGIVFRAFDETLQRVVALKLLAPQLAATSPARKRFLREARSSAQVRHENVVQVYEIGEQPLPYLVMEFIPGETLQQKLDRVGPLDVSETLRIGRQIAEGLAAAHATDLIHRDIKPANVLLEGGQNKVKITDFGLARAADDASISQSGIIAGTPLYMAPEQAQGQPLDQRADLFSLGSVLYQMVAGRPPFRANGALAVLKRVAEDTPRSIREIIPETPHWLCDIIAKLHAKNPGDRYQSAREVADVLADCVAQLKANSELKDYSRIPRGKPRRSVRWTELAATVALLVVLGVALAWWRGWVNEFFAPRSPVPDGRASNGTPQPPFPALLAIAPFTDADVQRIAALPAAEQVEEVRRELIRHNPVFNGKMEHKIEDGVVTEFRIVTDKVTDIAPIRVWNALRVLECRGSYTDNANGQLADLAPLKGMNLTGLTHLNLINTKVTDAGMVAFKNCKDLRDLNLFNTRVTDAGMASFKDCKALTRVCLAGTKVGDAGLAHFKGMPLTLLWIQDTGITDLSPLQGMPLEDIRLSPKNITRGLAILRDMKSLKTIGIQWNQVWPAAEFWQRYGKRESNP